MFAIPDEVDDAKRRNAIRAERMRMMIYEQL